MKHFARFSTFLNFSCKKYNQLEAALYFPIDEPWIGRFSAVFHLQRQNPFCLALPIQKPKIIIALEQKFILTEIKRIAVLSVQVKKGNYLPHILSFLTGFHEQSAIMKGKANNLLYLWNNIHVTQPAFIMTSLDLNACKFNTKTTDFHQRSKSSTGM